MIRIRRLRPRIPVGKLYELEHRPHDDPEGGFHGITRSPVDYLAPIVGSPAASAAVLDADREWGQGSTHWAVELDEALRTEWDPRDAPSMPWVGWWVLIPHVALFTLGLWTYLDSATSLDNEDNGMGAGIAWLMVLAPLGLPWSIAAFIGIPAVRSEGTDTDSPNDDVGMLLLVIVPAAINLVLHVAYRYRRSRNIRELRRRAAIRP